MSGFSGQSLKATACVCILSYKSSDQNGQISARVSHTVFDGKLGCASPGNAVCSSLHALAHKFCLLRWASLVATPLTLSLCGKISALHCQGAVLGRSIKADKRNSQLRWLLTL